MYRSEPDPYCYPGTTVLINRLNIRNQSRLDAFEAEMTSDRASEPLPSGRLSYRHYLAIHRHLFQDVYDWAGKTRKVRVSKGGNTFCYPENIDREMRRLFTALAKDKYLTGLSAQEFADKAAVFLADLNAIHPFREGNGRTQLSFIVELSERAGHPLDLEKLNAKDILAATIKSFRGDTKDLSRIIRDLIESRAIKS